MTLQISIAWSSAISSWSWEVDYDGLYAYGFEPDYLNAEQQAREAAKRMGADI